MLKSFVHFTVVNKITILKEFQSCLLQFPCFRLFPEGEPPGGTFRFGALGFVFFGFGLRFTLGRKKVHLLGPPAFRFKQLFSPQFG